VDGKTASATIGQVSWTQNLAVNAAPTRGRVISVGRSASQLGSFGSSAPSFVLGGVALRGYRVVSVHTAAARAGAHRGKGKAPAPAARISLATSAGQLLLVLAGGRGTSSVSISGLPARRLGGRTVVVRGARASVAVYRAAPARGAHRLLVTSAVPQTNSGTSLGAVAYVLAPN
jgi:hypothetical protein